MDNQLVWRLSNASLSAQSAPSASLITLTYPPNQPHLPHSSPSPICPISPIYLTPSPSPIHPISPICFTPHPPLSAQSDPSASLITLTYLPNQPHLPHSSPSPICPISPICLTPSPSSIPKTSKGFSKTYHFVVSLHNSLHIKSYLIVDLKNAYFCNYQAISIL